MQLSRHLSIAASLLASALTLPAATIYDSGIRSLTASDPQHIARIGRDGLPSGWAAPKTFPGVTATTSQFYYQTFSIGNVSRPYLQINLLDINNTGSPFIAAYLNAFQPTTAGPNYGLDTNYLGDAGFSANAFPNSPAAFQILVPQGSNIVLAVNNTAPSDLNQPFRIQVEGFYSTSFSEVPEPATWLLLSLAAIILVSHRKVQHALKFL